MESRIQELAPTVEWKPCRATDTECHISDLTSAEGYIKVPSSYDVGDSSSTDFHVYVQKFTSAPDIKVSKHIIFLSGGPGSAGRTYDYLISTLISTHPDWACYTIDHRGLGKSGGFSKLERVQLSQSLSSIAATAAFPLKHLTMTNAALDVGMLAGAISGHASWSDGSQLIVYGSSYGAQLAHHVIEQLPNTFHHALMKGTPRLASLSAPLSHQGVVELCEMNENCRRLMGGNVGDGIREAIKNISNPDYNQCTRIIWDDQSVDGMLQGEVAREIVSSLRNLLTARSSLEAEEDFHTVQVAFAAIKATSDCKDPSNYRTDVLNNIKPYIDKFLGSHSLGEKDEFSALVNSVIFLDKNFEKYSQPPPLLREHYDLQPHFTSHQIYYDDWKHLRPYLEGMKRSVQKTIDTSKTSIHMTSGRIDMITPYLPAFARFNAAKAPVKTWLLGDAGDHDVSSACANRWLAAAIQGDTEMSLVRSCIASEDEKNKLDWTFAKYPEFSSIWNQVYSADKAPPMTPFTAIPNLVIEKSGESKVDSPSEPFESRVGNSAHLWYGLFGLLVVSLSVALWFYLKKRRSTAEKAITSPSPTFVYPINLAAPINSEVIVFTQQTTP
jgi:pimeloyl-ACP methyl ester carboxylesterase